MKALRRRWPEHKLILICRKGLGDFFVQMGLVDQAYEVVKGDAKTYQKILSHLRGENIDKVFSPHSSVRTGFFVRRISARQKIAFRSWWNAFIFQSRVHRDLALPDPLRQLSLLGPFDESLRQQLKEYPGSRKEADGHLSEVPAWASMSLKKEYEARTSQLQLILQKFSLTGEDLSRAVALFPGSVWGTKRWTPEGFIEVGRKLREQGLRVLVMGGPGEENLCSAVASHIPDALNICGQTKILESGLILSRLAAVLGNDSASMHLAATAETPTVVVFGPTVLNFGYRPWQNRVFVLEKDLPCRPCGKHGPQKCPLGTHACMKQVPASEALEKLEKFI